MIEVNGNTVSAFTFPGGERQVRLPDNLGPTAAHVIRCAPWSSDEVMDLFLTIDALRRDGTPSCEIRLELWYLPYARQDRACSPGEAFSLQVFATLLNAMKVDHVDLYAPHSPVAEALIERAHTIPLVKLAYDNMFTRFKDYDALVAPDKGALREVRRLAAVTDLPVVECAKTRDPATGRLSDPRVHYPPDFKVSGYRLLIVDDICDGGRTFEQLGAELKRQGASRVDLWVAHGIFSRGRDIPNIDATFCWHSKPEAA